MLDRSACVITLEVVTIRRGATRWSEVVSPGLVLPPTFRFSRHAVWGWLRHASRARPGPRLRPRARRRWRHGWRHDLGAAASPAMPLRPPSPSARRAAVHDPGWRAERRWARLLRRWMARLANATPAEVVSLGSDGASGPRSGSARTPARWTARPECVRPQLRVDDWHASGSSTRRTRPAQRGECSQGSRRSKYTTSPSYSAMASSSTAFSSGVGSLRSPSRAASSDVK